MLLTEVIQNTNQTNATRLTELTRRKQRTNSQYPVEHVKEKIGFMGFSPTTVSYATEQKHQMTYATYKIQFESDENVTYRQSIRANIVGAIE